MESAPATLTPDLDADVAREAQARRVRLRRMLALATAASAIVLGAIGWWTHHEVERSMRATRGAALKSVLDAQAKSLEVWIENQKLGTGRLARDRQVRDGVRALTAIAQHPGATPQEYCASPARRRLVEQLDEALAGTGTVAFNLVDAPGRIIASNYREYCGLRYRAADLEHYLAPVFRGETLFVPPHEDAARLERAPQVPPLDRPLVWVRTPVRDDADTIIAALGVGHYADEQFSTILAAARAGASDEVYAFARDGVMLSKSRFETEPVVRAILATGSSSVRGLVLRPPLAPEDARTRLVEAAIATAGGPGNASGMLLDPYSGYLGTPVVGGWRRLGADDMFLAIEMSAEEAYAPLEVLDTVFGVVFGALVVAVIVALASWFAAVLIRAEVEKNRMGAYWLGERIGEGGVGNVFRARHDLLKRPSAVKLLKPTRATDELTARFQREARLASQLTHPNMVEIYDYGIGVDGTLYYAMEFLEGDTVGELVVRGGPMPVARAVHILRQVCAGLAEAHGKGMVHRDISVTNIMACHHGGEYDFVKILDFGLVKNVAGEQSQTITRSLRILGTPQYMAPERLRDPADVDARADVYAVGAVAFFLLCGRRMFETEDTLALTSRVLNDVPPRLSAIAKQVIPSELEAVVAACLEKERESRPPSILAVKEVLDVLAERARWSQGDAQAAWRALHAEKDPTPV
jgi:serine/threonine-protein kinase